jgi:hypothetical protein
MLHVVLYRLFDYREPKLLVRMGIREQDASLLQAVALGVYANTYYSRHALEKCIHCHELRFSTGSYEAISMAQWGRQADSNS